MAGYRSWGERELLKAEAEMRVRAGQSRADVARELGVPLQTLAAWACQGGWRLKDLEAERGSEGVRACGEELLAKRAAKRAGVLAVETAVSEAQARLAADLAAAGSRRLVSVYARARLEAPGRGEALPGAGEALGAGEQESTP